MAAGCSAPSEPETDIAFLPTPGTPDCLVNRMIDGDTVELLCRDTGKISARLVGFDTPETYRPSCQAEAQLGARATAYLETRLRSAEVITYRIKDRDKYDRALLDMTLGGQALSEIMISSGLARPYSGLEKRPDWCKLLSA